MRDYKNLIGLFENSKRLIMNVVADYWGSYLLESLYLDDCY